MPQTPTSLRTITAREETVMPPKKKGKKPEEKLYSYDEYRKAFCVNPKAKQDYSKEEARVFGVKLAEQAMKKVKHGLQQR
jgi:hypothetical protein